MRLGLLRVGREALRRAEAAGPTIISGHRVAGVPVGHGLCRGAGVSRSTAELRDRAYLTGRW